MTGSRTLRNSIFAALALGLVLALVHPELVFSRRVYASADASAANAFATLGRAAQAAGEVPLWNPFVFGGMPSYASFAFLPDVYPLQMPLRVLVEALRLPPMSWMLLHVWLFGVGTTFYLRWRGLGWAASTMAGAACMLLPAIVAWGVHGHGTKLGTIAWLPWALWAMEAALRRASRVGAALFGALFALMLLRYHVQVLYYCAMALTIVGLALLVQLRRERGLPLRAGWLFLAALLAIGTAMQIYLPVWEYQALSIRGAAEEGGGAAYAYATNWSLAPAEMSTFLWPTSFGYGAGSYVGSMPFTDYPNYIGLPILLLALLTLLWRRHATVWAWWAVAILSVLVSFGKHGGLYGLFYQLAPFFDKFRVPSMILILQQFALVVLAAEGLDALLGRWSACSRRQRQAALTLCLLLGGIHLFLGSVGAEQLRQDSIARWSSLRPQLPAAAFDAAAKMARGDALRLGAIFALGAVALAVRGAGWRSRLPLLLVALPLWDLYAVTAALRHPEAHLTRPARAPSGIVYRPAPAMIADLEQVTQRPRSELAEWLKQQEPRPRVWPIGLPELATNNDLAAHGVVNLGGYHAAKLQRAELLRERVFDRNPPALRLVNAMATRWVIVGQELPAETLAAFEQLGMQLSPEPAYVGSEGVVYENRSALPRVYVAGAFRLAQGPDGADFDRIARGEFDLRQEPLLEREPTIDPRPGAAQGSAEIVEEGFDWVRLRAQLPEPGLLVLADPWYPGWRAQVDGASTPLLRANVHQRALALAAGTHEVELRLAGGSYANGRRIAALSAALLLLGLLAAIWVDRRRTGVGT